jgi:diaminohydroxyphosphoribosylaminopyrimidine deaminase/5-amino-6-(5-phosphoribosylamino)uracil reductase
MAASYFFYNEGCLMLVKMTMSDVDLTMIRHALALAKRGRGFVEPNPLVGAVVVRDGKIVGEGWHQCFGGPHAEIHALQQAGDAARGSTLYVTLEPCCHHGKTPPCTAAIAQAGIARVVAAMPDPFLQVNGGGLAQLRQAGIDVVCGVGQKHAERLNAPYLKLLRTGTPWVIAKWAMTLDGRIATATGDSKWISNEQSRAKVHQLRGRMDAILVGIGTVLADDPLLTARPAGPRRATRVILDSKLRLPITSQLARSALDLPVLIYHDDSSGATQQQALRKLGCQCQPLPSRAPTEVVRAVLEDLGKRRFTNVLVEGGAQILGSFFDARAVDEVWTFIAPKWIGSATAHAPLAGIGVEQMEHANRLANVKAECIGDDVLIRGWTEANRSREQPSL